MQKVTLILILVFAMGLAACQGQSQTGSTTIPPTLAAQPTVSREAVATTATEAIEQSFAEAPPGCTVVSSQDTTSSPTEQSIFPPVSETDWILGAKDAAITLIEYSDFQ